MLTYKDDLHLFNSIFYGIEICFQVGMTIYSDY